MLREVTMSRRPIVVASVLVVLGAAAGFSYVYLRPAGERTGASTAAKGDRSSESSPAALARREEALAETLDAAAVNLRASLAELRSNPNKEPVATVEAVARKLEELERQARSHRDEAARNRARVGAVP
jgi:hypothetical protein